MFTFDWGAFWAVLAALIVRRIALCAYDLVAAVYEGPDPS